MPMVYSNNGYSFGNKEADYICQPGEVILPIDATPAQILAAFPNHAAGDPTIVNPVDQWDVISLKISFNHENRIRALELRQPITVAQFKTALKAL